MSSRRSGTSATRTTAQRTSTRSFKVSKDEVEELNGKLAAGIQKPVKQKQETEILLVGQSTQRQSLKRKSTTLRPSRHPKDPNDRAVKFVLSSKSNREIVGVLPRADGTIYDDEPERSCPVCQNKMSWCDITDIALEPGACKEAYICGNTTCMYLPVDTPIREVQKRSICDMKETTAGTSQREYLEAVNNNDVRALISHNRNILDRTTFGGAKEPDMDLVNKVMKEFIDGGRKKHKYITFPPDVVEKYAMSMIFGEEIDSDE